MALYFLGFHTTDGPRNQEQELRQRFTNFQYTISQLYLLLFPRLPQHGEPQEPVAASRISFTKYAAELIPLHLIRISIIIAVCQKRLETRNFKVSHVS